jgi:hypothetical protein
MKTTDYIYFQALLNKRLPKTHKITILGNIDNKPMLCIQPKIINHDKNILITAGFHGEERAPCWGLLLWLRELSLIKANITIIPVVNPDGFSKGTRYNQWNEIDNDGFIDENPNLSHEGKILWKCKQQLIFAAKDGFISLHESPRQSGCYYYLLAEKNIPALDEAFKKAVSPLTILPNGKYHNELEGSYTVHNGCVLNQKDNSFEHYLKLHEIPICITSETSMISTSFKNRVVVTQRIIHLFIEYMVNHC